MAQTKFQKYIDIIIDNIEGGYYHPNMKEKNPDKFAVMGSSGETMYGMDRVAGAGLFKSESGKAFWAAIDKEDAAHKWTYNYKPTGTLATQLKGYVCDIQTAQFNTLAKKYLKENTSIVENDDCLCLHFFYGCWNGSWWFKYYAEKLNAEIARQKQKSSKLDMDMLRKCALNARINNIGNSGKHVSLIEKGGLKMQQLWKKYFGVDCILTDEAVAIFSGQKTDKKIWPWIVGGAVLLLIGGGIWWYNKR